MSYLNDSMLIELCKKHGLVTPFDSARVNPASVDLALGREFVNLSDQPIEHHEWSGVRPGEFYERQAEPGDRFYADRVLLRPGIALLATTAERVRIPDQSIKLDTGYHGETFNVDLWLPACTGELRLKSSAARNGLDHALAGWIDPGFGCGVNADGSTGSNLTLELHAHRPIELLAGKCYVQLVVATMFAAPARSYQQTGRYVGESAIGAVLAKEDR